MSSLERTRSSGADLDRALQHAGRHESRRALCWLLATVVVTVVVAALTRDTALPIVVVGFGVGLLIWSLRLSWGVRLALRDFRQAVTPPRRAYVVLLEDTNPRAIRPLLGIWSARPPADKPLPKPDLVYRCDDELADLKSYAGDVVVHEAWIDTGHTPSAKPRWIVADAGIAVPHRRAILGRWYASALIRHDRPAPPKPLTISAPAPVAVPAVDHAPLQGSLLRSVGWRCAVLTGIALLAWWVS
jgi:hypothetical protein